MLCIYRASVYLDTHAVTLQSLYFNTHASVETRREKIYVIFTTRRSTREQSYLEHTILQEKCHGRTNLRDKNENENEK